MLQAVTELVPAQALEVEDIQAAETSKAWILNIAFKQIPAGIN